MKTYTEATAVIPVLAEVTCNMCGHGIGKTEMEYFDDYLSVEKTWGYHSPMDGEAHEFDICAGCYRDWVKAFKIPPGKEETE